MDGHGVSFFFLLYVGPVILKYCLTQELFQHFMLLSVACRILSSELAVNCNDHAKQFLRNFVSLTGDLYGAKSLALNMHSLIHLADDAKYFKIPISDLTAFPFESFLGRIKKLFRSDKQPLAQVSRRLHEISLASFKPSFKPKLKRNFEVLKSRQGNDNKLHISKIRFRGVIMSTKKPDNSILLNDGEIIQIQEIICRDSTHSKNVELIGSILKKDKPLLKYPCDSKILEMWKVSRTHRRHSFRMDAINRKMILFTFEHEDCEKMYTMPILHM